jgi:hypothetical protein
MSIGNGSGTVQTKPLECFDAELRLAGYRPARPPSDTATADELWCLLHACPDCRTTSLQYRPYLKAAADGASRATYRALALCRACGQAEEL